MDPPRKHRRPGQFRRAYRFPALAPFAVSQRVVQMDSGQAVLGELSHAMGESRITSLANLGNLEKYVKFGGR